MGKRAGKFSIKQNGSKTGTPTMKENTAKLKTAFKNGCVQLKSLQKMSIEYAANYHVPVQTSS